MIGREGGASNMVMNSLTYDMNMFKTLETLEVRGLGHRGGGQRKCLIIRCFQSYHVNTSVSLNFRRQLYIL